LSTVSLLPTFVTFRENGKFLQKIISSCDMQCRRERIKENKKLLVKALEVKYGTTPNYLNKRSFTVNDRL